MQILAPSGGRMLARVTRHSNMTGPSKSSPALKTRGAPPYNLVVPVGANAQTSDSQLSQVNFESYISMERPATVLSAVKCVAKLSHAACRPDTKPSFCIIATDYTTPTRNRETYEGHVYRSLCKPYAKPSPFADAVP